MTTLRTTAVSIVCLYLCRAGAAHAGDDADAVVDWNAITEQAVLAAVPPHVGAPTTLDYAMVHAAVYDAVQAIEGDFEPFLVDIPGAYGSPQAAAAAAAHDVLVQLFPAQAASLDATYADYLASHDLEDDPGLAVGQEAAAGVIANRADDGSFPEPPPPPFIGGTGPGVWRPTPPASAPMAAEWLATVRPFTLIDPDQFRARPPPAVTSDRYTRHYKEVKRLGSIDSVRTPEQQAVANFWALNFGVQWNLALRDIATAHVHRISDSSRLFALANLAAADAAITSWDSKRHFVFWRPITAIQEGDSDGNPRTHGDAGWLPMLTTPPYPDYTSGANNVGGAMSRSLALFFGTDRFRFTFTTDSAIPGPRTRTFERFSDAAQELVDARVYHGVHFRFADTAARTQGRRVASWVFKHYLRPVCDHDDDRHDARGEEVDHAE